MGAGLAQGGGQVPDFSLAFRVGGPLAMFRPEGATIGALVTWVLPACDMYCTQLPEKNRRPSESPHQQERRAPAV